MQHKQNIVLWIKEMLTFLGTDDHKLKKCLRTDDHKFKTANVHNTRSISTHFTSTWSNSIQGKWNVRQFFDCNFFLLHSFAWKFLAFMLKFFRFRRKAKCKVLLTCDKANIYAIFPTSKQTVLGFFSLEAKQSFSLWTPYTTMNAALTIASWKSTIINLKNLFNFKSHF